MISGAGYFANERQGMSELDTFMNTALELAEIASKRSVEIWRGDLSVSYKQDGSSLTQADLSIETEWREILRQRFPDHGILGEEFGSDTGQSAFTWVLDPIDGTRSFAAGLLNYASLIALCRDGLPVLGIIDLPLSSVRYSALEGRGTVFSGRRVYTSGQTDLNASVVGIGNPDSYQPSSRAGYRALSSAGRLRVFDGGSPTYGALSRGLIDVCINGDDLEAFDICALCPVVQQAGGVISDWKGQPLTLESQGAIVASASQTLHESALQVLSSG
jgi:histidinol phosphatase-like enzyme (inositol monophosphatase family)